MLTRKHTAVDGLWVTVGYGWYSLCSFVLNMLLAHLLSSADMGKYFLVVSSTNVLSLIASLGLGQIAVKEIAASMARGDAARAGQIAVGIFRCTLFGCGAISAMMLILGRFAPLQYSLVLISVGWVVLKTWQNLLTEMLRGFQDIRAAAFYGTMLTYTVATVAVGVASLAQPRLELNAALYLLSGGWGVAFAFSAITVRRKLVIASSPHVSTRQLLSQGWPVLSNSLLWMILTQIDLWILTAFRSTSEVAMYGVITRMATLIGMPEGIAQKTLAPTISELHAQGKLPELGSLLRNTATVASLPSLLLLVIYIFASRPLLGIFYGDFYRSGVPALIVLGIAQLFNVATGLCGTTMIMTGHQRSLLAISTRCGFLTAGLALVFARPFGVPGVAGAAAAGFIVQAATMLVFVRRRLGIWTHAALRLERSGAESI